MNPILLWTIRVVVLLCVYTFIATMLYRPFIRVAKWMDDSSSGDGAIAMAMFWLPVIILAVPIGLAFVLPWNLAMTFLTRKERAEARETKKTTLALAEANRAKKQPTPLQQELMSALKLEENNSVYLTEEQDTEKIVEDFLNGRITLEEFNQAIKR